MVERLKQIWSGFEQTTERRLTGRGIDNIAVPHRQDWRATEAELLAGDIPAPAEAAFAALKAKLSAHEQRKENRRRHRGETRGFDSAPPSPLSATASAEAAPEGVRELIRGLRATEARVERPEADYETFLAANGGKAFGGRKRRKFFGLF